MSKYCMEPLPLEKFGLTSAEGVDRWNSLTCVLPNPHNGPHETGMGGEETWLVGRFQWIQPFPDYAARIEEASE